MHVILWRFRAAPALRREFEQAYGPSGPWARLFRRASGYLGTELLRGPGEGGDYLVLDRWESAEAWQRFRRDAAREYADLDRRCEALTEREEPVGDFTVLVPPPPEGGA